MNHSHNNQPNHDAKMMWWMIAGCLLLPLLLLLFFNKGAAAGGGSSWAWLVFVVVFIVAHVGMFFGHGKHHNEQADDRKTATNDDHSDSENQTDHSN